MGYVSRWCYSNIWVVLYCYLKNFIPFLLYITENVLFISLNSLYTVPVNNMT